MSSDKRYYFIDEAGDSVLFNRRGKVIVASEGNSRFFMLGLLQVPDPVLLGQRLDAFRREVLADPYFAGVPSLLPESKKTALAFHAKDDLPEIRKRVFELLRNSEGLRFYALVRDKYSVLAEVRQHQVRDPGYRYHPDQLYERMVPRLLRDRLHKADEIEIVFAQRGKKPRTQALRSAIEKARKNFYRKYKISSESTVRVTVGRPQNHAGLQAVDYFLWALQRLYERGEDRYLKYLWHHVRLIVDADDRRRHSYGAYYGPKNVLSAEELRWRHENEKKGI